MESGRVLYEMLVGRRPFRADHDDGLIHAIRHEKWQPVDRANADIPPAVTSILERCLAKDPDDRYHDAGELLTALEAIDAGKPLPSGGAAARRERWRSLRYGSAAALLSLIAAGILIVQRDKEPPVNHTVSVQTRGNRLAVLPMTPVDSEADEGYLADGITDELIAQLSRIGGLRVIARASVMVYKGGSTYATEVGKVLAVETVLHGSVHRKGDQVEISLRLVDTKTQEQLWTRTYSAPASELQSVQREIALGALTRSVSSYTVLNSASCRGSAHRARMRTCST